MRHYINKLNLYLKGVVSQEPCPHRISLAFAIGVFIAFAPHIGLHTASVLGLAWLFKMNLPIMMAGALVNNPWTIIPIYGFCLCLGNYLLGNGFECLPSGMSEAELMEFLKASPLPFIVGTLTAGIIAAIPSYFAIKRILFLMHFKNKKDTINT